MKFRLKTTLCLVCLLSLLFGGGSSALIALSFQSALTREQEAAKDAYTLLLHTVQLVSRIEVWTTPQDAARVVQQLSAQGSLACAALSLVSAKEVLVLQGDAAPGLEDLNGLADQKHIVQTTFSYQDRHYLQLAGQIDLLGQPLLLNVAYDISSVYQTRQQQQQTFGQIFLALLVVCALVSYSTAWVLTRPLDKLAKTAQALADGDLSRRTGPGRKLYFLRGKAAGTAVAQAAGPASGRASVSHPGPCGPDSPAPGPDGTPGAPAGNPGHHPYPPRRGGRVSAGTRSVPLAGPQSPGQQPQSHRGDWDHRRHRGPDGTGLLPHRPGHRPGDAP